MSREEIGLMVKGKLSLIIRSTLIHTRLLSLLCKGTARRHELPKCHHRRVSQKWTFKLVLLFE